MRIVLLGTYDSSKPRTRILRRALRQIDPDLQEVGFEVWGGVGDKSMLTGWRAKAWIAFKMGIAYPVLIARYLFAGRHDVVVIGYMGLFDMLLLAPLARLKGKPVVWDAFLSIYDTYARDRGLGRESGFVAKGLKWMERSAARLASTIVLDTKAHGAMMARLHAIDDQKIDAVLVGAEDEAFGASALVEQPQRADRVKILFYGQFIPLHGINTIVDAALDPRGARYDWMIVGNGQEAAQIDARLSSVAAPYIQRVEWIEYDELQRTMLNADVTLGIFGTSEKAASVIPNKVFQAFLCGKPIITQDSPAMRELVPDRSAGLYLVPPGDPSALLDALEQFSDDRSTLAARLHQDLCDVFSMPRLTDEWRRVMREAIARKVSS